MDRDPRRYSRLLVLAGLVPLLFLDATVGLPEGGFVGGGALVLAAAAGIHFYGDQPRAGAGWLAFAASLALFAVVDVAGSVSSIVALLALLGAGVLLVASERRAADSED